MHLADVCCFRDTWSPGGLVNAVVCQGPGSIIICHAGMVLIILRCYRDWRWNCSIGNDEHSDGIINDTTQTLVNVGLHKVRWDIRGDPSKCATTRMNVTCLQHDLCVMWFIKKKNNKNSKSRFFYHTLREF